jgi:hypothetical protein
MPEIAEDARISNLRPSGAPSLIFEFPARGSVAPFGNTSQDGREKDGKNVGGTETQSLAKVEA